MSKKVAGLGPGERHLNGLQTIGRQYSNLCEPSFAKRRTDNVGIPVRNGTTLLADLFQPDSGGLSGADQSSWSVSNFEQ
jgi:hypothetical protein